MASVERRTPGRKGPSHVDTLMRTQTQWIRAVANGRVEEVATLIDHGFNVDFQSPRTNQFTALHYASQAADDVLVEYLLDRGATIDLRTSMGVTALHLAACNCTNGDSRMCPSSSSSLLGS